MAKINVIPDCGNSPRKEFLRDFEIAFAESNYDTIVDSLDDQVYWNMVGDKVIEGKEAAREEIKTMTDGSIEELNIESIITHGDEGAVSGTMKFKDGTNFGFCDVYKFTGHDKDAKIKKMTSYVLAIK